MERAITEEVAPSWKASVQGSHKSNTCPLTTNMRETGGNTQVGVGFQRVSWWNLTVND